MFLKLLLEWGGGNVFSKLFKAKNEEKLNCFSFVSISEDEPFLKTFLISNFLFGECSLR